MRMSDIVILHKGKTIDGDEIYSGAYGPHLLLDCHLCNVKKFTRANIKKFMKALCKAIKMDAEDFHFWDDEGVPEEKKQTEVHAVGTSVGGVLKKKVGVQFIITSSIVIHTIDLLERVYIDIFSCTLFDEGAARSVVYKYFEPKNIGSHLIQRN